jgi:hypothetical protein
MTADEYDAVSSGISFVPFDFVIVPRARLGTGDTINWAFSNGTSGKN